MGRFCGIMRTVLCLVLIRFRLTVAAAAGHLEAEDIISMLDRYRSAAAGRFQPPFLWPSPLLLLYLVQAQS
jgi:hypothetical protein